MTATISTIDAKKEFSELISRVSHNKERIILTRRDKEIAVIIPIEDLAYLKTNEDKNDLEAALQALNEARSQGAISLEQLKEEIGDLT